MTKKIRRPISIILSFMMILSVFTIVPFTASAATATVTLTWEDFGDLDIYDGETASAKGVNITVDGGGNFVVNENFRIRFADDGEYTISMADGSLITNIVLNGDDVWCSSEGWNGNEWLNPNGAASVIQTSFISAIDSITITYITADVPNPDQEAADAVSGMIDELPAEVTLDDADAIEAARAAYDALTEDQKALLAPETLAKLEAAEEALNPKLVNNSEILTANPMVGAKISVKGKASGGAGDYTYAFYYKKSSGSNWYQMAEPYTTNRAAFKPAIAAKYDVKVIAKDAAGKTEEKIITVKVNGPLTNKSYVVTTDAKVGEKVRVKGAASGGAGDYTYAFYYKKSSGSNWYQMAEPYTTKTAAFKPAVATSYDVKVIVKDADGNTEEVIYTVDVAK